MASPRSTCTLVMANLTASTPKLREEIARRASAGSTQFLLLIPAVPEPTHPDWTPEVALRLLERAAPKAQVQNLDPGADAMATRRHRGAVRPGGSSGWVHTHRRRLLAGGPRRGHVSLASPNMHMHREIVAGAGFPVAADSRWAPPRTAVSIARPALPAARSRMQLAASPWLTAARGVAVAGGSVGRRRFHGGSCGWPRRRPVLRTQQRIGGM
jgi:hypothetical protein